MSPTPSEPSDLLAVLIAAEHDAAGVWHDVQMRIERPMPEIHVPLRMPFQVRWSKGDENRRICIPINIFRLESLSEAVAVFRWKGCVQ